MRMGQQVLTARILSLSLRLDSSLSPTLSCLIAAGQSVLRDKLARQGNASRVSEQQGEEGESCTRSAGTGHGARESFQLDRAEPMLPAALGQLALLQGVPYLLLTRVIHLNALAASLDVKQ